jgi:phosphoesterase RecJ-like protein
MERKTDLKTIADMLQEPDFDRVLVACHRSPDGDACGSAHALAYALRKMGKCARVFCPDPFGEKFSYLTAAEEGLFSFEAEHFITVDIASPEMLCGAEFADRIDVVIDHHRINTVSGKYTYIDPEKASCAEIVLDLLKEMKLPFDSYLASALYTGIATDTGCFRYSNTNANTFFAAAFLSDYAEKGDFYRINKLMFETKSMLQIKLEAYAAENVKLLCDGKIAALSFSEAVQKELGATYADLDHLINVIRQIEGVQVSIVAKEREAGEYKVSVRSEEGFDASEFCRNFGGGGHRAAAGCTLLGGEAEVMKKLLLKAEEILN